MLQGRPCTLVHQLSQTLSHHYMMMVFLDHMTLHSEIAAHSIQSVHTNMYWKVLFLFSVNFKIFWRQYYKINRNLVFDIQNFLNCIISLVLRYSNTLAQYPDNIKNKGIQTTYSELNHVYLLLPTNYLHFECFVVSTGRSWQVYHKMLNIIRWYQKKN